MQGSDDSFFQEAVANLAFMRGAIGDKNDGRFVRGRIAILIWLPGLLSVLLLGAWLQSWIVIAAGIPLLLVVMWLIVVGPRNVAAVLRRRVRPKV
ncbi:MAG: hypothetical protein E6J20_15500 [Chloroflexi bacterium]|nr:MAG: hypothetical protein E6J20_15500 [Chloroflexota bacterium]